MARSPRLRRGLAGSFIFSQQNTTKKTVINKYVKQRY